MSATDQRVPCTLCESNRHYQCEGWPCSCGPCGHQGPQEAQEAETTYPDRSIISILGGRPDPDGIEMGVRMGMPVVGCGHDASYKWLTRHMVVCQCGLQLNRETFWEVAMSVEVLAPKVHCNRWRPGDPVDKHHAPQCTAKGWSKLAWDELTNGGES